MGSLAHSPICGTSYRSPDLGLRTKRFCARPSRSDPSASPTSGGGGGGGCSATCSSCPAPRSLRDGEGPKGDGGGGGCSSRLEEEESASGEEANDDGDDDDEEDTED